MGGNLNLKKSFDPSILRNQAKVFAAEKHALQEKKKTQRLQKERDEERSLQELRELQLSSGRTVQPAINPKLARMYRTPSTNESLPNESRKAYLLGKRRIDDLVQGANNDLVGSTDAGRGIANTSRDTATRVLQDPLLAMSKVRQQQALDAARRQRRAQRDAAREAKRKETRSHRHHGRSRSRSRSPSALETRSHRHHEHARYSHRDARRHEHCTS